MFKKLAAEALGLSDIGIIISPADYGKVDADDYLFHEDGEKIFFLSCAVLECSGNDVQTQQRRERGNHCQTL